MLDARYLTLSYIFLPVTPQKSLVTSFLVPWIFFRPLSLKMFTLKIFSA